MRKTALVLVVTAAMLALWPGAAMSQTSPGGTLDANSLPKTTSVVDLYTIIDSYYPASAQTFTAMKSGALTSAQVQMFKLSETETVSDLRMQIATVDESGSPTDDILAETTLPASAVVTEDYPGLGDLVTVKFGDPAQVEEGKKYALIYSLESPSATYRAEYALPIKSDVYPGGSTAGFSQCCNPDGLEWVLSPRFDHVFAIYVTPAEDTTAPKVDTVKPANGTKDVPRGTNLRAIFSEQMDPASIDVSTFKLFRCSSTTPSDCTTQVTNVTASLSTDGLKAVLNPFGSSHTRLAPNTKYEAVVTTGTKDLAGNSLDQNANISGNQKKAWYFTTGSV